MPVICVTGMPGCGKEEFIKVCADRGYEVTRMGDVVREEARRRGLGFSDSSVGGMADEERRIHGPGIWARRTISSVRPSRSVIDGVRSAAELEVFRDVFAASLTLIAIISSPETRFQRLVARGREDDIVSQEEFETRERREISWGLDTLIELADICVYNEGTLEEFRASVIQILGELEE